MHDTDRGIYDESKIKQLSSRSPWLTKVFPKLLFEEIRDAIKTVPPRSRHNPFLYEALMADVCRILDRCLAYRRECADLERQAVSRSLEYQLFEQVQAHTSTINTLRTATDSLQRVQEGQLRTAAELAKSDHALKALTPAYAGGADAALASIENQSKMFTELEAIQRLSENYQADLQLQHTTPGHAMNYAERRQRVVELLKDDIAEAYEKAMAAEAGLRVQLGVYTVQTSFPTITGNDDDLTFLDRLVRWACEALRVFERSSQDDLSFELVLPINLPYFSTFTAATLDRSLVSRAVFQAAMKDKQRTGGLVTVPLADAIPTTLKSPDSKMRLRALGLSAGVPDKTLDQTKSWSAVIFLPSQSSPYGGRELIERGPLVLGRVLPYSSNVVPAITSGDGLWNADPLIGPLQLLLFPMALEGSARPNDVRNWGELTDLKLHVRLVARASRTVSDWSMDFAAMSPAAPAPVVSSQ